MGEQFNLYNVLQSVALCLLLLLLLLLLLQAAPLSSCSAPTVQITAVAAALLCSADAAVGCQAAAPSAAGCSSCSAARAAPSCSTLLLRIMGSTFTIVCSAVLPLPGLELATAPLALANQQLSLRGRTCLVFNQVQPEQCGSMGSILEHSVGTNPQFGQGSTADRLHTSRLSLSPNCSVTAPNILCYVTVSVPSCYELCLCL